MNFLSDNTSGILPQVAEAFASAASGFDLAYGRDSLTSALEPLFSSHFGRQTAVVLTLTGTAANALALAVLSQPYEAVLCHSDSHIQLREAGAPEFFTQGAKLVPVGGPDGRIDPDALAEELGRAARGRGQSLPYTVVSLTQPTELGTLYSLDEVRRICDLAHAHGARVHMDGARFPHAVNGLGCSPAAASCEAGVDVLSFGATKSGGFAAEAVVLFDPGLARKARLMQKRSGQTLSKMRFLACQWGPLLEAGGAYQAARIAVVRAAALEEALRAHPGIEIICPRQANLVFATMPGALADHLARNGVRFAPVASRSDSVTGRFVTSFETTEAEVAALAALLQPAANR